LTCTAVISCRVVRLEKYSRNCHLCCDICPPTVLVEFMVFFPCKQVQRFYIHLIYIATALTPDPVQNLTAAVNPHKPSVTLSWDPPANAAHARYVTKYEIHLQDRNNSSFHGEKAVDGSTTTTVITKESGLRPLTTFTFKVRACCHGNASQEWRTVSRFIGMQVHNLDLHL